MVKTQRMRNRATRSPSIPRPSSDADSFARRSATSRVTTRPRTAGFSDAGSSQTLRRSSISSSRCQKVRRSMRRAALGPP
jgi:hypothetical protein